MTGEGPVDVHAHFVPPDCFTIPTADGTLQLTGGDGSLLVGDLCMPLTAASMSKVDDVLADMDRANVAVRVLSGPPFTFATGAVGAAAADYAARFNTSLSEICSASSGRLIGLGLVPLQDVDAACAELDRITELPGLRGIAVPPVLPDGSSFDAGPLRHHAAGAAQRGLAVLVHPTQPVTPDVARHYLSNLIGNPNQTAVGVASLLLGGLLETEPALRICFLHGGGSTSALLGRWDHGWRVRADVSTHSTVPPSTAVRQVYFDTLTHEPRLAAALSEHFDPNHIVLGSDFPFDMGEVDPVRVAEKAGLDIGALTANAHRFLG